MKVGDAVRWLGFDGHGPEKDHGIGLIVEIKYINDEKRFNVSWPDGTFGRWLYSETIRVVSESR